MGIFLFHVEELTAPSHGRVFVSHILSRETSFKCICPHTLALKFFLLPRVSLTLGRHIGACIGNAIWG